MYTIFENLVGQTITSIVGGVGDTEINIYTAINHYRMYHEQDCCEHVCLEEIVGDIQDIIGTPIIVSEVCDFKGHVSNKKALTQDGESSTWTFYKIRTIKGEVVLRWYGSSNGYYSESVTFEQQ